MYKLSHHRLECQEWMSVSVGTFAEANSSHSSEGVINK